MRLGGPAPRARRAPGLRRRARPHRPRPVRGRRRQRRCATSTSCGSPARSARGPTGTDNAKLPTGEVELGDVRGRDPLASPSRRRSRSTSGRRRRRDGPAAPPLPRPAPRPHAAQPAPPGPGQQRASARPWRRQGFVEIETPMLIASTPEGRPRLRRAVAAEPRAASTPCPRARSCSSSCAWSAAWTATTRSPAACATRTSGPTASSSSCSSTSRPASSSQDEVLAFISEAVAAATEAATGVARPSTTGRRPAMFPQMTWHEAEERFGTDKPDVRFGMELVELTPVFADDRVQRLQGAVRQGHPGAGRGRHDPQPARRADRPGQALGRQGPGVDAGRGRGRHGRRSTRRSPSS